MFGIILTLMLLSSATVIDKTECPEMLESLRAQEVMAFEEYKRHKNFAYDRIKKYNDCLYSCNHDWLHSQNVLLKAQEADRRSDQSLLKLLNISNLFTKLKYSCGKK